MVWRLSGVVCQIAFLLLVSEAAFCVVGIVANIVLYVFYFVLNFLQFLCVFHYVLRVLYFCLLYGTYGIAHIAWNIRYGIYRIGFPYCVVFCNMFCNALCITL